MTFANKYKAYEFERYLKSGSGRADQEILSVAAKNKVKLVLMYAKDPSPRTARQSVAYDDVIATIISFLEKRISAVQQAGVGSDQIIIDPGLGHFVSSDPKYSFEIIARLNELTEMGYPVFISPSHKSFLAGASNLPTKDRLPATIVASALAAVNGASYIRTHDVLEVRRACEIAQIF